MPATDYPAVVRRHFLHPAHVGPLAPAPGTRLHRGEAGSAVTGAWVIIEAAVHDATIDESAFRAYGCPYLLAASSRAMEILAPGPVARLRDFDPAVLGSELAIPAEKLGSLLILQDALRNCFRDWDTTRPAGAR